MSVPQANRDLNALRPDFRERLEKYLDAVRAKFPHLRAAVHETLRTQERQDYLYKIGREPGYGVLGKPVTWTKDSNHLYGIAADWHFYDASGAIWDGQLYEEAYAKVPPGQYDLETLAPKEYVHIQLKSADERRHVTASKRLKLHQDGQFVQAWEIPAGKRTVIALEADGSINVDVRSS